jgi:hypothetical protein
LRTCSARTVYTIGKLILRLSHWPSLISINVIPLFFFDFLERWEIVLSQRVTKITSLKFLTQKLTRGVQMIILLSLCMLRRTDTLVFHRFISIEQDISLQELFFLFAILWLIFFKTLFELNKVIPVINFECALDIQDIDTH